MVFRLKNLEEKKCPKCRRMLSRSDDFYPNRSRGPNGTSPYCRECMTALSAEQLAKPGVRERRSAKHKEWYRANTEEVRARQRNRAAAVKAADPALWRAKKFFDSSRSAEIAPDVTRDFIADLFRKHTRCACCGIELCLEYAPASTRKSYANSKSPSIDRVNNRLGYTRSNIAVICWQCNARKSDLTLEDLEMFRRYIAGTEAALAAIYGREAA